MDRPKRLGFSAIFLAAALAVSTAGCVPLNRTEPTPTAASPTPTPTPSASILEALPNIDLAAPEPQFTNFPTPTPTPPALPPQILAAVNNEPITREDFDKGYAAFADSEGRGGDSAETRGVYLNILVGTALLEQEARRLGLDNDPGLHRRLAESRRRLIEEALLERALARRTAVSDAEIEADYKAHKKDYSQPTTIQVRNITADTPSTAAKARARILAGEDFAAVAQEISTHPSRSEGGSLPAFAPGTYNTDFERHAFGLRIGELSAVFSTDMGYHVIEKTGETPGRVTPLSTVRDEIRERISLKKRRLALEELNRALRSRADIRVLRNP